MAFLKVKVKGAHWCPVLCNPMDYTMQSSLGQNTGVSSLSILQGISPTQGADPGLLLSALPAEPPGNPKNTGVSSLSLLQGIFLTQGLNPYLLHCRQILYQLSHKGSPVLKGPESKYFSLCELHGLYGNYPPLCWEPPRSHWQKVNEWVRHGTNKALFRKRDSHMPQGMRVLSFLEISLFWGILAPWRSYLLCQGIQAP